MMFRAFKMFILLTSVSPLLWAAPVCDDLVSGGFTYIQVSAEDISPGFNADFRTVRPEIVLSQYKTRVRELRPKSTKEILELMDSLLQKEQSRHGGLTGIRDERATSRSLILDMTVKNENSLEGASMRLWSNHFRNALNALTLSGLYPAFFKKSGIRPNDLVPFKFRVTSNEMSTTTDFRFYSTIVQQEVMRRLIENPRTFFEEADLQYPQNDQVLRDSLADLSNIVYVPH